MFGLFTGALVVTHTRLILYNLSTVEHISIMEKNDSESYLLSEAFSWFQFSAKARTKRAWDAEWGNWNTEGNIWWMGSARKNWESVMGTNVWWWFLPIGKSGEGDGLDYPVNARFDEGGRYRRRSEWPEELR